ncbi:MAG: SemiSWEET transporter [Chitinophagaceae bacterium]
METSEWVGIIAGVLTSISMLPQLIKMIKEKKAQDVSLLMLLVLIFGVGLWVVYGFMKKDIPIIASNSFSVLINLLTLFFRIRYKDK